ncbi:MAG: hypothetical protein IIB21_06045 [Chloroflexi bacterium]|nr:hypothetical protein [Chloroflexota bacterium]
MSASNNFISAYVAYAKNHTSAPETFHQFAALSVCAAALGNRVWVEAGFGRVYPAPWVCLIGPSAVHKSSAVNLASGLLIQAAPDLLLPQDFSREALLEHLQGHPFGLLAWPEFGVALESFSKEYNAGVLSTLTDIFDSRAKITRLTKSSGLIEINYPSLSILAGGKIRWLKEYIKPRQVGGGFMGRWMFVMERKNGDYLSIGGRNHGEADRIQRGSLVEMLARLAEFEGGEMALGEGLAPLDAWLEKNEGRWSEDEDPAEFSQRAGVNVLKLAMAIQASQGVHFLRELHPTAVEQAIELWNYSFDSGRALMREVIGHSVDAEALEKIERVIRGAKRIRRRDLLNALHMKLKNLEEYIVTLIESGRIVAESDRSQPGPTTVWYVWKG